MIEEADTLFQKGDYKAASVIFEKIISTQVNPLVLLNLGRCYQEIKKYQQAIQKFEDASQLFIKLENVEYQSKAQVLISECHKSLGENLKACQVLKRVQELNFRQNEIQQLIDDINLTEAEKIAEKYDIELLQVEQGFQVKKLISEMTKLVREGSKWFVLDMAWVKQWQEYIYLDLITGKCDIAPTTEPQMPDAISWTEIVKTPNKNVLLQDPSKDQAWSNIELKENLREGEDFMLVTQEVFSFAEKEYGIKGRPIERYGIKQADGETCVELYLKKIQIIPVPSTVFKIDIPKSILISRTASVKDLTSKILRVLNATLYSQGNKILTYQQAKLWKYLNNNVDDILALEKRQKNYTTVEIDALLIEDKIVDDMAVAAEDIIVVELQHKNQWVFSPIKKENIQSSLDGLSTASSENSRISTVEELTAFDLSELLNSKSRRGAVGLQNLGNTCFMNSGLQCLSNSQELTKFFLLGKHQKEINKENPLGMGGKLAKAYAGLLNEMWLGTDSRTAPHHLKQTLGSKISRFSGYGQQDSAELVNYILDLLHEDLNRVTKKPYIEMIDKPGRPDKEVANEFWDNFLARNKSIIVDLMYGQLKSTVTCLTCQNPYLTFDPYLMVQLPITRQIILSVSFLKLQRYTNNELTTIKVLKLVLQSQWKISDVKQNLIQTLGLNSIGHELLLANVKNGKVDRLFSEGESVMEINNTDNIYAFELITSSESVIVELNFLKQYVEQGKKQKNNIDFIRSATPRLMAFDPKISIKQMKENIVHYLGNAFYKEALSDADGAIDLQIMDNLPIVGEGNRYGVRKKVLCEFCKERHDSLTEHCELEVMGLDTRDSLVASKVTLQNILDQIFYKRQLVLAVILKPQYMPKIPSLRHLEDDNDEEDELVSKKLGVTLASCFNGFQMLDTLTGDNQYYCKSCKTHTDSTKKLEIFKIPKLMIIQLKRFASKGSSGTSGKSGFFNLAYAQIVNQEKIGETVNFPVEGLDMRPYVLTLKDEPEPVLYDLYGVSNHYGSLNGGHYTATVKNCVTGKWYNMNDGSCSEQSGTRSDIVSSAAYLLFYRKRD